MSAIPFIVWALGVVFGIIVYICVASIIEKSGEERLGATGHLFIADPDRKKSSDKKGGKA